MAYGSRSPFGTDVPAPGEALEAFGLFLNPNLSGLWLVRPLMDLELSLPRLA